MSTPLSILRHWAILIGFFPILLSAQGWQRFHGGTGNDRAFAIQLLPNGDIVAAGSSTEPIAGTTDWYFLKTDSLGNFLEDRLWGDTLFNEGAVNLLALDQGAWLMCGTKFPLTGSESAMAALKLDASGGLQSAWAYNPFTLTNHAEAWADGYLLLGEQYVPAGANTYFPQFYYQKLDSAGATIWQKTRAFDLFSTAQSALTLPDGNAILVGSGYPVPPTPAAIVIVKINGDGDSIAARTLPSLSLAKEAYDIVSTPSGNPVVIGTQETVANGTLDILLLGISQNLDSLWASTLNLPGSQRPHAAISLPNGNIAIAGEHIPEGATSRDGFLALCDSMGHLIWFKVYGGLKGDIIWDLQPVPDGNGFFLAGQTASFSAGSNLQAWLLRTDSLGTVWSNRVIGRVVRDLVENCVEDASEPAISAWLVTASGETGTLYTSTDSLGAYSMEVDTGTWFVSVLPPAAYWSPCEDSVQVYMPQFGDTLAVSFPVQAVYDCPLLDVDLMTPYLRRCYENTFYVHYFNYGTAAAPNALISIHLDPFLSITGSNWPYTQTGDTLYFSVGLVESLEGGDFEFSALLNCDSTVLGQTHCSEAHIFPDSLCYTISPDWDGAHLEVDGICAGDSVLLRITNTGQAMLGAVNYIIVEDQIIFKLSTLQLDAGQDTTFVLYPGGSTVTIVVQQTPGHPGNNQPVLVIEGCGGFPFSTGYALQFPQNDGDPSTDIECRQNIGSFDPNDKTGLPTGLSEQHLIAPATTLEYLIRFQNTGTDTAFRVEIRDTLPGTLDLATFRQGASSHPYQLKISESGILSFLFDPIALPDSGANWAASQGFLKFRIAPKTGLSLGTAIKTRASIYFDLNPPVHTPQTLHTLGDPFQHPMSTHTNPVNTNTTEGGFLIAPNPTVGNILVSLAQPLEREGLRLGLLDAQCQEILAIPHAFEKKGTGLSIDLSAFPAGLYFVTLKTSEGKLISTKKVIKM